MHNMFWNKTDESADAANEEGKIKRNYLTRIISFKNGRPIRLISCTKMGYDNASRHLKMTF